MIDHGLSRLRSGLAAGARKSGIGVLVSGNAGALENARQADRNPENLIGAEARLKLRVSEKPISDAPSRLSTGCANRRNLQVAFACGGKPKKRSGCPRFQSRRISQVKYP